MSIEIKIVNENGVDKKSKEVLSLSEDVLNSVNIHEFERYFNNYYRVSRASSKTRGEVAISTKKMYKQKGTGNARRGANSSPHIRGGGVAFGPIASRVFRFGMNNKVIRKVVLSLFKMKSDDLYLVEALENLKKTKQVASLLKAIEPDYNGKYVLLKTDSDDESLKAFNNISNVVTYDVSFFSPEEFVTSRVLLTQNALKHVQGVFNVNR
jgi:large subunit ribosomal protein L4